MATAQAICDEPKQCGTEYVVWLPDSEARFMSDVLCSDPELKLVQVCREDEAIRAYTGLYLGAKEAAILIQNRSRAVSGPVAVLFGGWFGGSALCWPSRLSGP